MTLKEIRYQQYLYHKTCPFSKDWNWNSPYTFLKAKYYMEWASVLVWALQDTFVSPNFLTLMYGFLGLLGGVLIGTGERALVLIGIYIVFNKSILDLADGHLARLKNKVTKLGSKLDRYMGVLGTYSFYGGVAIYTFRINPYVLIYFIPLMFFKSKGRACIIDLICLLIILSMYLY